jgi:hypothetical protein
MPAGLHMSELICLMPKTPQEIECVCFDRKACDIHIDDGGQLVCRHGSNEGVVDGVVRVICPIEIASEKEKWDKFLAAEKTADS